MRKGSQRTVMLISSLAVMLASGVSAAQNQPGSQNQQAAQLQQSQNQQQQDQQQNQPQGQRSPAGAVMTLDDVEVLNDQPARYDGRQVRVPGEVSERVDDRSFILESGGWIDDEILVVLSQNATQLAGLVNDDAELIVTGTVRTYQVVDIERETGWDFNPEIEAEFEDIKAVIIASDVRAQND